MSTLWGFVCVFAAVQFGAEGSDSTECVDGSSRWYVGKINKTASGRTCQRWDVEKPHKPKHVPHDGPHHNYCRNPDIDLRGTWCYTTDNDTRWEYCNITKCPDDSMVIWTSYNVSSQSSHLLKLHADPEVVRKETDVNGSFSVSVMTSSNQPMTEYWALAANYRKKVLYFTDYKSEYFGVWDMEKRTVTKYLEGMARGIEFIAFDWITNNLYWSDSYMKWVMAADSTLTHYTPVYRTAPDPAYGIAIHSTKRFLFFSTHKHLGSKIIRTDLSGAGAKTMFSFPEVFDVSGMSVDYTDDRLYWTDYTGYGGVIMSSRLDGSHKKKQNSRGGTIFWGVAPYSDYIYVSDVNKRFGITGDLHHTIWILGKDSKQQIYSYKLGGKPRGVAVYSHNEEYSIDESSKMGGCDAESDCHHICLPRINATRVCGCSLGYHLDTDTNKCLPELVKDNYMLVTDAGQGRMFQIPFASGSDKYSIVPIGAKWKAETVAVDQSQQYLYWSDKTDSSVSRSSVDGSRYAKVASSYANSIIVDPHTGQLFYSDNERDSIMISRGDGSASKTIVKPDPDVSSTSNIRMIAQDIKYKRIYWTDTYSKVGEGKVMRCRYDGSQKETVFDKLDWPHAIFIDYKTDRLYVVEAKQAVVYEVTLPSQSAISNTSIVGNARNIFNLSSHIGRKTSITDLKIHEEFAYILNNKLDGLKRFSLKQGISSMASFGPSDFFRITTLSVFNETFYSTYIKPVKNPCEKSLCREMCVALSDSESTCLCQDRKMDLGFECVEDSTVKTDTLPPEPLNCPGNSEITLPTCSDSVLYSWNEPSWRDDTTASENLTLTSTLSPPSKLGAGQSEITHSAQDEAGNVGYCRFTVTVRDNQCPPVPNARANMKRSEPTCGNREGSHFNVTCSDTGQVIWVPIFTAGERQIDSYQVTCSQAGVWVSAPGIFFSVCKPPVSTRSPPATTVSADSNSTQKIRFEKEPSNGSGQKMSLAPGAAAAIAVGVVIIVIIIVMAIALMIRKRGTSGQRFPMFWNSSNSDNLNPDSSANAYQIMT